jgi:hypothetical protein
VRRPLPALRHDAPPEHQSAAARKAAEHHELRDAIEHKTEREKAEHAADPVDATSTTKSPARPRRCE